MELYLVVSALCFIVCFLYVYFFFPEDDILVGIVVGLLSISIIPYVNGIILIAVILSLIRHLVCKVFSFIGNIKWSTSFVDQVEKGFDFVLIKRRK